MGTTGLVVLKLDEEAYAEASGGAYRRAEEAAQGSGQCPNYPEPFNTIGCGYGPLAEHVKRLCSTLSLELGLDADFCHQTDLMVTLYCGTAADYAKFEKMLGERMQPVKEWVRNRAQLWPITEAILEARKRYLEDGLADSLEAINEGLCGDFSDSVIEVLGGVREAPVHDVSVASFQAAGAEGGFEDGRPFDRELLTTHWPRVQPPGGLSWESLDALSADAALGDGTHVWLTDGVLHYDAECPHGVGNFFDLPFFQRIIADWRADKSQAIENGDLTILKHMPAKPKSGMSM